MSTGHSADVEVAIIGAGVVGCACALALVRRGVPVALLEAEAEVGLAASGTNSGILHTGFDSAPGELETDLILRSAALRERVLSALGVGLLRCGAVIRPPADSAAARAAVDALAQRARRNGVEVLARPDGSLEIPGEAVTDPVAFTLALAGAARRHGAELFTGFRVVAIERAGAWGVSVRAAGGATVGARLVVNCAGLWADAVARLAGDDSFQIYPRKGEFLVFEAPAGAPLERILLPVPRKRTKGVLVFPTLDGKVIAGPTAVDIEDKHDWSVRPQARDEILASASMIYPPLRELEPIASYAGLRPAGRSVNYVVAPSRACPEGLVNVAAIRSTGLTASLGIAERVAGIVSELGIRLAPERALEEGPVPARSGPWWRRTAEYRAR
jgi:glycerol-3-phosphate dehydrogenase